MQKCKVLETSPRWCHYGQSYLISLVYGKTAGQVKRPILQKQVVKKNFFLQHFKILWSWKLKAVVLFSSFMGGNRSSQPHTHAWPQVPKKQNKKKNKNHSVHAHKCKIYVRLMSLSKCIIRNWRHLTVIYSWLIIPQQTATMSQTKKVSVINCEKKRKWKIALKQWLILGQIRTGNMLLLACINEKINTFE